MQDRRFVIVHGGQYEGALAEQYEDRPKPEVNKCKIAQRRLNSEYRKNPITADFIAKDGDMDERLADQLDGAYRSDEQEYGGQESYDACADEAFAGGKGAYRLNPVWEDEFDPDNENQRVSFEPIPDADVSVGWDLNSKRQDKSDAMWGGIVTAVTPEGYKENGWGEAPADWPRDLNTEFWDWYKPRLIYIFEYYRIEIKNKNLRRFKSATGDIVKVWDEEIEDNPEKELMLLATLHEEIEPRTVKVREVYKYIMDGAKILEDCGRVPGNIIPIVPQFGERYIIDGIERFNGFVRTLKDPQRTYNMLIGLLSELAVNGTQELPIFDPAQLTTKIANEWATANQKRPPYLQAKKLRDNDGNIIGGAVEYTKSPNVPPSLGALLGLMSTDIKELTGESGNPDEIVSNISGKAVELIQQIQDLPSFIFLDNARKARKRGVEIWLEMAKELYVEKGRFLRTVDTEGGIGRVEIGKPRFDNDGGMRRDFDLENSSIGVYADVGPASVSKKAATARELLNAAGVLQPGSEDQKIVMLGALMNMEGEGISEFRPFWRRQLVDMGALPPDEEDKERMKAAQENQEPDTNEIFMLSEAEKNDSIATKNRADTELSLAKAEETEAKTLETLSGIDRDDQEQAMKAAEAITQRVSAPPQQTGE